MGDNAQNNQDSFERHYNRFKEGALPNGMRLSEGERVISDRVITQYLRKNFNGEARILMDSIDVSAPGGFVDVEAAIIADSKRNWDPDYSDGLVSDTINMIKSYVYGEEIKTPEQIMSDQNARIFLNEDNHGKTMVENVIGHTQSLEGFSLEDAKGIARSDLLDAYEGADVSAKFPDADPNVIRAVAYTLLHVSQGDKGYEGLQGQKFDEIARSFMHYAHEESKSYSEWEMDRRIEIINGITGNPLIMADLALIRAPGNIETAGELSDQFKIRGRVADAIMEIAAKNYGMSESLDGDDVTVVYKSGAGILKGGELGYMSASGNSGILNDETIIIRYNPALFLMENLPQLAKTDSEEVLFFLKTAVEEIQHGIDHVQTDRLVLGTLPEGAPIERHSIMSALNGVVYAGGGGDNDEAYKSQYIEKAAKEIADDVAFEVVFTMENPQEAVASQYAEHNVDDSSVLRGDNKNANFKM